MDEATRELFPGWDQPAGANPGPDADQAADQALAEDLGLDENLGRDENLGLNEEAQAPRPGRPGWGRHSRPRT
jgi:hypothetical protein